MVRLVDYKCKRFIKLTPGCSQLDVEDTLSNVLRISRSFEEHCALTNADEANEVQQNVTTVKKGKMPGTKAILRRSR